MLFLSTALSALLYHPTQLVSYVVTNQDCVVSYQYTLSEGGYGTRIPVTYKTDGNGVVVIDGHVTPDGCYNFSNSLAKINDDPWYQRPENQ